MPIINTKVEYVSEIDWSTLAVEVESRVMTHLTQMLESWKDDLSMRQMFMQDTADSLTVCEHLSVGNWQVAESRLFDMDTAARDVVFDFIEEVAGREFFDLVRG